MNCRSSGLKPPQEIFDTSNLPRRRKSCCSNHKAIVSPIALNFFVMPSGLQPNATSYALRRRCRKASVRGDPARGHRKSLTTNPTRPKEEPTSSSPSIEFGFRSVASRRPQQRIWFETSMHFSFYLMIAALVILGVEVAYALYQLANYFL